MYTSLLEKAVTIACWLWKVEDLNKMEDLLCNITVRNTQKPGVSGTYSFSLTKGQPFWSHSLFVDDCKVWNFSRFPSYTLAPPPLLTPPFFFITFYFPSYLFIYTIHYTAFRKKAKRNCGDPVAFWHLHIILNKPIPVL